MSIYVMIKFALRTYTTIEGLFEGFCVCNNDSKLYHNEVCHYFYELGNPEMGTIKESRDARIDCVISIPIARMCSSYGQ